MDGETPKGLATGRPQYDAFISYSHAADDALAPALQAALQRFAKPWHHRRALRVFRDQSSLAATPELWPAIEAALDDASHFLLLASPEAAQSRWVRREVAHWLATKPAGNLLIVLTGGELVWDEAARDFDWSRTDALPSELKGVFPSEPLWVDLRWAKGEEQLSLKHPRFLEAVGDLAAPLHGRPKEDLLGEDVRQHKRTVRLAAGAVAALALLLVAALAGAGIALEQRGRAEAASQTALARQLAAQAGSERTGGLDARLLLSLEANRLNPDAPEARGGLLDLLSEGADLEGFIPGLSGRVDAIEFRPDGAVFVTAGSDGMVVWDAATRQRVAGPLGGSRGYRQPVAFTPDGTVLATSWQDGVISLFDGATFAPIGEVPFANTAPVVDLAFSPDGGVLAAASAWKERETLVKDSLTLWDWRTGTQRQALQSAPTTGVNAIAFSPDGETLVSGGESEQLIVWNWRTGERMATFEPGAYRVMALAFSPDGKTLAIGGEDRRVRLWNATEWTSQRELVRPNDRITNNPPMIRDLAFSPDGDVLAAAGEDGDVHQWVLNGEQFVSEPWGGHGAPALSVAFSPDGKRLVSGSANGTLAVRSTAPAPWLAHRFNDPQQGGISVAISPDGQLVAGGDFSGDIHFWETASGAPAGDDIHAFQTPVFGLAFSSDGRTLAAGDGNDGTLALWDVASRTAINDKMIGHTDWINTLVFLDDDKVLASSSGDGTVRFWDAATGEPLGEPVTIEDEWISYLAVTPDERWLAAPTANGVALIDVATRQQSGELLLGPSGGGEVAMAVFSPDSKTLAAVGEGGAVLIDVATREPIATLQLPEEGSPNAVAFSPDGALLATGGIDGQIRLWDLATMKVLGQLPRALEGYVILLFFTPDGRYLIGTDYEGAIVRLDMDTDQWTAHACAIAGRNLTIGEWAQYVGDLTYEPTCPEVAAASPATPVAAAA